MTGPEYSDTLDWLLAEIQHRLHVAKTWNGQGWTYNHLAGHIVKQIDELIEGNK